MTAGSAMADSASWLARNADQATQLAAIEKDMKALLAGPHAQARYQPRKTKRIPSEWASDFKLAKSCATKAVLIRNGRGADVPIGEGTFEIALGADDLAEIDRLFNRVSNETEALVRQTVASNHAGCRGVIDSPLAFRGRSGCVDKGGD